MLNKQTLLFIAALFFSVNKPADKKHIPIFMAGDSTMSVKETKAYPDTGWGMPFKYFFDSTVSIVNKAKNGRSTKTFISEGLWESIITNVKEGDYVFIQFGHNDESKDKVERYTTPNEYRVNIQRFIMETEIKKGIPVLLTPVSRRKFKDGMALQTHEIYSDIVRQIAKDSKVLFIDMDEKTRLLYQSYGEQFSKMLFNQLTAGEHPHYPDGKEDNTHYNELGARLVAQIMLAELKAQKSELINRLYIPVVKK